MPPLEPIERIVGATVLVGAGIAVLLALVLAIVILIAQYFPRFHLGVPANPVEWHCYAADEILTTKNGVQAELTGRGRLIRQLDLLWWAGISSRQKSKWFFGFMRWEESR